MLSDKDLSVPLIIEIFVPGIICIFAFFPLIYWLGLPVSPASVIYAGVLAIPVGFLLVGGRLYSFTPGYKSIKETFYNDIKHVLDIQDGADYAFIVAMDIATQIGRDRLNYYRSYWTMTNHVSKSFFLGALNCLGILVHRLATTIDVQVVAYLHGMIFCVIVGILFGCLSKKILNQNNSYWLKFIESQKQTISKEINKSSKNCEVQHE